MWQNLRICGTTHGHKVPYSLSNVPVQSGEQPYVPRKAIAPRQVPMRDVTGALVIDERTGQPYTVNERFRVRTVPQVGLGRRKAYPSTIRRTT